MEAEFENLIKQAFANLQLSLCIPLTTYSKDTGGLFGFVCVCVYLQIRKRSRAKQRA